jgi:Undecaprenyl-phosphate glucose phosphotransferase
MLKAHSKLFEHLTLAADLTLIAGCWVLAYVIRFSFDAPLGIPPFHDYALQLLPILVVWGIAFHAFDLYRPHRLGSYLSEWLDVAKASTLGVLVLVAIMTFFFRSYEFSRLVIGIFWALSIVAVSFSRAVFREILRFARRRGYNQRYAVIVGGGDLIGEVLRVLWRRPDVGIQVLGVLCDKPDVPDTNVQRLGGTDELRQVLASRTVDIVFIALPNHEYQRMADVLDAIDDDPVAIHLVPDVLSLASLRSGIEEFEGVPFIHLRESPLFGWNRVLKRLFDLIVGGGALIVALPLMMSIAALIRLTSGGPVLYSQERMGLDGRRFRMLKFRTMRVDAEDETGPVWARPHDPRTTRIGAILRRWSLDELPQLINVLAGAMSLVGPRPERPELVQQFRSRIPGYMLRHKVKAGMTGWAQINGWRGNTSLEKRIEDDLRYIERWSLTLDVKILVQTVWKFKECSDILQKGSDPGWPDPRPEQGGGHAARRRLLSRGGLAQIVHEPGRVGPGRPRRNGVPIVEKDHGQ